MDFAKFYKSSRTVCGTACGVLGMVAGGVLSLALLGATPAWAQADRGGWALHAGGAEGLRLLSVHHETPVWWHSGSGVGRWELTGEFGLSWWHRSGSAPAQRASLWQVSAVPMWRWWPGQGVWFVEGGIGASLISATDIGQRRLSTGFQFSDHLGVGMQWDAQTRIGLRYTHVSNASLKKPNNGLDALQLTFRRSY